MDRIKLKYIRHERGKLMKLKRKHIIMIVFVLLSVFAYSCWLKDSSNKLSNEDFIRFHVVANSNSDKDQRLKLIVRDRLMSIINEGLVKETMASAIIEESKAILDIDRTKEFINRNLAELESEVKVLLSEAGCYYPVKAELGVDYIPKKTYGNVTFPAGNYNALKVILGEGKGENWWCVLFPPLCLIGEMEELNNEAADLFNEVIMNERYKELIDEGKKPKTLKLKFKILELAKNGT